MSNKSTKFEISATEYLKEKFSSHASFEREGGSNSTSSDIHVNTTNRKNYYIEVKENKAQSGQFVLLSNTTTRKFEFSLENESLENEYTKLIQEHMNDHFDYYYEPEKQMLAAKKQNREHTEKKYAALFLENGPEIYFHWIIDYYKNKSVRFLITGEKKFIIFPIEKLQDFFTVSAQYRIKRSGSSEPSKKDFEKLNSIFSNQYSGKLIQREIEKKKNNKIIKVNKFFLKLKNQSNKKKEHFLIDNRQYFINYISGNKILVDGAIYYELRKLSETYNANVIFSIKLINDNLEGLSDEDFISSL